MKLFLWSLFAASLLFVGCEPQRVDTEADPVEPRSSSREVGRELGRETREAGRELREFGEDAAKEAKEFGQGVREGFKETEPADVD